MEQFRATAKAVFSSCVLARPQFYLGLRGRGWLDQDVFLRRLVEYRPATAKELRKLRRTIDLVVTDASFYQALRRPGSWRTEPWPLCLEPEELTERLLFNASRAAVLARMFHQSLGVSTTLDAIRDRLRLKDKHFAALLLDFHDPDAAEEVLSPEQALLVTDGDFEVVFREDLWCPLNTGPVRRFKPAKHHQQGKLSWKVDGAAGNVDQPITALLKGPTQPDDGTPN